MNLLFEDVQFSLCITRKQWQNTDFLIFVVANNSPYNTTKSTPMCVDVSVYTCTCIDKYIEQYTNINMCALILITNCPVHFLKSIHIELVKKTDTDLRTLNVLSPDSGHLYHFHSPFTSIKVTWL